MPALHTLNLALTFLLEVAMLIALGYASFTADGDLMTRILNGLGRPAVVMVIWGLVMSPKAKWRLKGIPYLIVKFILFGWAALGLYVAGHPILAIVFIVLAVINQILLIVWGGHAETVIPD